MRTIATLVLSLTLFAAPIAAMAQSAPQLLETFRDWEAYKHNAGGQTTCYILSKPKTLSPSNRNHGDVFFFITSRPAEDVRNEVSVLVGYSFAADSQVTVTVDGRSFNMFTKEDGAWMQSTADEQQLVQAMRAGSNMTVAGQSSRGTNVSYTFSLSGVTAGSNRIAGNC